MPNSTTTVKLENAPTLKSTSKSSPPTVSSQPILSPYANLSEANAFLVDCLLYFGCSQNEAEDEASTIFGDGEQMYRWPSEKWESLLGVRGSTIYEILQFSCYSYYRLGAIRQFFKPVNAFFSSAGFYGKPRRMNSERAEPSRLSPLSQSHSCSSSSRESSPPPCSTLSAEPHSSSDGRVSQRNSRSEKAQLNHEHEHESHGYLHHKGVQNDFKRRKTYKNCAG